MLKLATKVQRATGRAVSPPATKLTQPLLMTATLLKTITFNYYDNHRRVFERLGTEFRNSGE